MNIVDKVRYVGIKQLLRKYALKGERHLKGKLCVAPQSPLNTPSIPFNIKLLGYDFNLERGDRWHYSPDTQKTWPLVFSPKIHLTGEKAFGDVKLIWELNRHQFLPSLVRSKPELVRTILHDWIAHNPFEYGVNWSSAMEVGLRLISWIEIFKTAPDMRSEFFDVMEQHANFIHHNISTDWIPRNNHLIGEAASLVAYGNRYALFGRHCLDSAVKEQFYESGVNREQSVGYHHFVTHLLKIAGINDRGISDYLSSIQQPDGTLPNIGDGDDGIASSEGLLIPKTNLRSVQFGDAGVYLIRDGGNYCILRCGPFGLAPNYAHAHADLLSPIIWLRGIPVFIDTGTYTYNGDAALRKYFRSAHAHNVVVVDDCDFAEQNGTFGWGNPPVGTCKLATESEICGSHNAYRNLGVTIQRSIRYANKAFIIKDEIGGTGHHRLRWRFHIHPNLKFKSCSGDLIKLGENVHLSVNSSRKGRLDISKGMYAPTYNQNIPINVCEFTVEAKLPVSTEWILK